MSGVWPGRLASAGAELRQFINRFHDVAGSRHVIDAYFAGNYQRAVVRMAIRLSKRLAARDPDFRRGLHFDRLITFAPDGQPILSLVVGHRGLHYRLFPWRKLHPVALQRQLRRDRLVFGSADRVRWVFDQGLAPSAEELARQITMALSDGRKRYEGAPLITSRQIFLL